MSDPSIQSEPIARAVGCWLYDTGLTLAVAESCTGGLICDMVTDVPGSSRYFECGVVSYSNSSKSRLLSVDTELIHQFGAVSAEVAAKMAEGIARISGADLGLSTTGIAGPGGATPDKPVGLVYIGVTGPLGTETVRKQFSGTRRQIKRLTALSALLLVEDYISRIVHPD